MIKDLLRIFALWRKQYPALALGILVTLASSAIGLALMVNSGRLITASLIAAAVTPILLLRVLGPARVVARYFERLITHNATFRALANLRVWFFEKLAANGAHGLGMRDAGDMLSRLVNDIDALDGIYLRLILPATVATLVIPVTTWFCLRENILAGIAVFCLLGLAAGFFPLSAYFLALLHSQNLTTTQSTLRVAGLDAMTGLREIRAYGAQPQIEARLIGAQTSLIKAQKKLARRSAQTQAASFLCTQMALLAVLAAPAPAALKITAVFILAASFETLAALPRAAIAIGHATAAATRVLEIADAPPAVPAAPHPAAIPTGHGLKFEAVHFSWAPDRPSVLRGLTLDIQHGAKIAILGPSGAGKSTLAALMLKIAAPQSGRITLGGTDIADLRDEDLRRNIAWLGQSTHLFADTIRANLTLADPDASDSALWAALDRAGIGETVRALPHQLDEFLGESGARLSGGQGRRIALARVLLSEAPIIILDEPCAGLDAQTERAFLQSFFADTTLRRTVILITHRLTGVLDRIYRLSAGLAVAAAA